VLGTAAGGGGRKRQEVGGSARQQHGVVGEVPALGHRRVTSWGGQVDSKKEPRTPRLLLGFCGQGASGSPARLHLGATSRAQLVAQLGAWRRRRARRGEGAGTPARMHLGLGGQRE
jgi:hypothetical protein